MRFTLMILPMNGALFLYLSLRAGFPWATAKLNSNGLPSAGGLEFESVCVAHVLTGTVDWSQYGSASRKSCACAGAFIAVSYAALWREPPLVSGRCGGGGGAATVYALPPTAA